MKLVTKEIEKELAKYPLYSQEKKGNDARIVCKFFAPAGGFTWYVTEAKKEENDYTFFGLVINNYGEKEYGYFTLSQLESVKLPFGLKVERDLYFKSTEIKNLKS
jgi:hypothetical protein